MPESRIAREEGLGPGDPRRTFGEGHGARAVQGPRDAFQNRLGEFRVLGDAAKDHHTQARTVVHASHLQEKPRGRALVAAGGSDAEADVAASEVGQRLQHAVPFRESRNRRMAGHKTRVGACREGELDAAAVALSLRSLEARETKGAGAKEASAASITRDKGSGQERLPGCPAGCGRD
jgi:hypothetical protein